MWEWQLVQVGTAACPAHPGSTPAWQEKLGELDEARQRLEVCESRSCRLELQRRALEAELGRARRALAERDAEAREARQRAEQLRTQVPAPAPPSPSGSIGFSLTQCHSSPPSALPVPPEALPSPTVPTDPTPSSP